MPGTGRGLGPDGVLLVQSGSGAAASEAGDEFGGALAIGDLDGDRIADLAVGVAGETLRSAPAAGRVAVLPGGPGGTRRRP